MRWKPDKSTSRCVDRFAWLPIEDPNTGIWFWLEKVRVFQRRMCADPYGFWLIEDVSPAPRRPSRLKHLFQQQRKDYSLLWAASGFYWLWTLADELISRRMPPGFIEANPYARDMFGRFAWSHAFAHDLFYFFAFYLAAFLVARCFRGSKGALWAQLPGALYFLYVGLEHMDGFLGNLWAHLGWLVNDAMIFGR